MTASEVVRAVGGTWRGNASWMSWNLFLALVPLVLGVVVFRARRHNALWWVGALAFLAFLPNAPYVLTDVIHLPRDLDHSSRTVRLGVVLQYGLFAAGGLLAYALALRSVVRHLMRAGWSPRRIAAVELTLHALSAAGVYLGRVDRLNSWYVVTRPAEVLASAVSSLASTRAVALTAAVFLVIVPVTTLLRWSIDAAAGRAQALMRRGGTPL